MNVRRLLNHILRPESFVWHSFVTVAFRREHSAITIDQYLVDMVDEDDSMCFHNTVHTAHCTDTGRRNCTMQNVLEQMKREKNRNFNECECCVGVFISVVKSSSLRTILLHPTNQSSQQYGMCENHRTSARRCWCVSAVLQLQLVYDSILFSIRILRWPLNYELLLGWVVRLVIRRIKKYTKSSIRKSYNCAIVDINSICWIHTEKVKSEIHKYSVYKMRFRHSNSIKPKFECYYLL